VQQVRGEDQAGSEERPVRVKIVHCKREPFTKYIGRGSPLGNPFTHLSLHKTKALVQTKSIDESISYCDRWAHGDKSWDGLIPPQTRRSFLMAVRQLKDDDVLGCFCVPHHACHGDVIVMLYQEMKQVLS
jgi:Domain of unknown function (DUF4326)